MDDTAFFWRRPLLVLSGEYKGSKIFFLSGQKLQRQPFFMKQMSLMPLKFAFLSQIDDHLIFGDRRKVEMFPATGSQKIAR